MAEIKANEIEDIQTYLDHIEWVIEQIHYCPAQRQRISTIVLDAMQISVIHLRQHFTTISNSLK